VQFAIAFALLGRPSLVLVTCLAQPPTDRAILLQTERTVLATATECSLPEGGRWCEVHVGQGFQAFQMAVYSEQDIVSAEICGSGKWEKMSVPDFGKAGTALDIGANLGYYSFVLANAGWQVHAFEPLSKNLELFRATLCRNPHLKEKITLHAIGLGPKKEHCSFVSDPNNRGDGWTICGDRPHPAKYKEREGFDVHRLDDVLSQSGLQSIDFVKIDVEGFECQVFEGGKQLLSKFRPKVIQTEVWHEMVGCNPQDYLSMFTSAEYKLFKSEGCHSPSTVLSGGIENFWACRMGSQNGTSLVEQKQQKRSAQVLFRLD